MFLLVGEKDAAFASAVIKYIEYNLHSQINTNKLVLD